jgi:hypothetical protein
MSAAGAGNARKDRRSMTTKEELDEIHKRCVANTIFASKKIYEELQKLADKVAIVLDVAQDMMPPEQAQEFRSKVEKKYAELQAKEEEEKDK